MTNEEIILEVQPFYGEQGAQGEPGKDGVTFTPSVSENGDLSWTNDGGLENPATVNIKGQKGQIGNPGIQGPQGVPGERGPQGETGPQGPQGEPGKQGEPGADGVSPTVVVKESTDSSYVLTVTDKNGSYDTPNLKGDGALPSNVAYLDKEQSFTETQRFAKYIRVVGQTQCFGGIDSAEPIKVGSLDSLTNARIVAQTKYSTDSVDGLNFISFSDDNIHVGADFENFGTVIHGATVTNSAGKSVVFEDRVATVAKNGLVRPDNVTLAISSDGVLSAIDEVKTVTDGTITPELNATYTMTYNDASWTVNYPEVTDTTQTNFVLWHINFGVDTAINWGNNVLFASNEIPTIKAGYYDIAMVYNSVAQKWQINVTNYGTGA